MAIRKSVSKKPAAPAAAPAPAVPAVASTPVRNTAVPPKAAASAPAKKAAPLAPTHDQIAARAYEIWRSGQGGSEHENWARAERELRSL